MYTQIWLGRNA